MSQAILISNNEVINSLYEVNLRAYVATNVTIKKSLTAATQLLEHSPNIDVVICFRELNNKDNAIDVFQSFLEKHGLKIPVIVLGEPNKPLGNSIVIKNKYDIRALLKAMAKILQITAQQMSSIAVPEFFPVPIKLVSNLKQSHCDIFYRAEKENFEYDYFEILKKETAIGDSLKKYLEEGVQHLYIDAQERLRFINRASGVIVSELERDDLTKEERVEISSQGMGVVAEEIFESEEISDEMAQISMACVKSISQVVKDVPKLKGLLAMLLENQADYIYKHSVVTTYVATQIINNISWGSKEQQEKVAFALFFHDIYLVPIYRKYPDALSEEDLLFRDDVEEKDKKIVLEHAALAGSLVKTFPRCPMGADMIVTQHHGMTSGKGFAVNYKDDISPLSKIIIIAEDVSQDILTKLDKGERKNLVDKDVLVPRLEERYKNHTYRKVIDAFKEAKF